MLFFGTEFENISEADLMELVQGATPEGDRLEFKRDIYGTGDEDKREMLRDISAMANAQGGHLLIGVEAKDEAAVGLPGVEAGQSDRLLASCLHGVDPRIPGLRVGEVPVAGGKVVIIFEIPQSANAPHMVTFKSLNQFWRRHGRQRSAMSVEEIRDAVIRVEDAEARIERFWSNRRIETRREIEDRCFMVLSTIPAYFRNLQVLPTDDEALRRPMLDVVAADRFGPSLHGALALSFRQNRLTNYLEVFRNGYVEYGRSLEDRDAGKYYAGGADTQRLLRFLAFVRELYSKFLPATPVILSFEIFNSKDLAIAVNTSGFESIRWSEEHLDLGRFPLDDPNTLPIETARRLCTVLWNAFHLEAPSFNDDGTPRTAY